MKKWGERFLQELRGLLIRGRKGGRDERKDSKLMSVKETLTPY